MPRLSVVIPVYQHADACARCLASLAKQTRLPDEVVVVDDGSTDNVQAAIAGFLKEYPVPLSFVRFEENRGAPAVRNEGARRTNGEYIIFLDADIELAPTMLEKYEMALETHTEADIAYSAHDFGWKRFSLISFDKERLKQHNFIHMSSLLRRKAFPGFDERLKKLQDWDLWLTMVLRGSKAIGIDEVLFHLEPRTNGYSQWLPSFMYLLPWKRLGWAPRIVRKYQGAEEIVRAKHGLEAYRQSVELTTKTFAALWGMGIVFTEILSFLSVFHPNVNTVICLLIGLLVAALAMVQPVAAVSILATEFLIGSKGALFKAFGDGQNNGGVSLRIVLFAAFFVGWAVNVFRVRAWKDWGTFIRQRFEYGILAVLLFAAFAQGFLRHSPFLLADANAWVMWLLLLPLLDVAKRGTREQWRRVAAAACVALCWLLAKTSILFYLFSHSYPAWFIEPIYLWVRRTGVGEITRAGGNVFRIFFQSHIYPVLILPGLIFCGLKDRWLTHITPKQLLQIPAGALASICLAVVAISLSRSFFLGLALAGLTSVFFAWRERRFQGVFRLTLRWMGTAVVAGAVVAIVCFFPLPPSSSSLLNAWQSRISTGDDASASRWKLLPAMWEKIKEHPMLGHGFGSTVTYTSRDPRVVQSTGGVYTTYVFEWGWLEHWIKFGILGIPLLLFILFRIGRRIAQAELTRDQKIAVYLSLVALAVVHVSTPYLNHPLGFAWLIALEALAERTQTG